MIDDGQAIHYTEVPRGAPVYSADEIEVGKVEAILDNYKERIFDGVVFKDGDGVVRFADAPEVTRTAERGVTLAMNAEECRQLAPPDKGTPSFRPRNAKGRLGRMFGGNWKRQ